MAKRMGLGKGLDALFSDNNTEDGAVTTLKLSDIEPNKSQPRTEFEIKALEELADSITQHGVIQPLLVRPMGGGGYQIVAGERRWRAARMAGLSLLPVVIRQLDDTQTLEIAIVENLQREDLNPMEISKGYNTLVTEFGLTQEEVAKKVGISRSSVANMIRLLGLPKEAQQMLVDKTITIGHAKALLSIENKTALAAILSKLKEDNLLVRDIEKFAKQHNNGEIKLNGEGQNIAEHQNNTADNEWGLQKQGNYREIALELAGQWGRKVKLKKNSKAITFELELYDNDEMNEIIEAVGKVLTEYAAKTR